MQNMKENQYIKALTSLKEGETFPQAILKEILKNPPDSIIMDKIGNPMRTNLATKMLAQLKNIQQQKPNALDDSQHIIILMANLAVYYYYEENSNESEFLEKMEEGYKQTESIPSKLNDQQKAILKLIMGITYKIAEYNKIAVKTFHEAISLFKNNIDENSKYIRDCFLNIMESHINQASNYSEDDPNLAEIPNEYSKAIKAAEEALLILSKKGISLDKLYYYKGQIFYFLAKYTYQQKTNKINAMECIKFLNSSIRSFLVVLISTKIKDSQIKLYLRLKECHELFKSLESSYLKENISDIQNTKYNYAQLNKLLTTNNQDFPVSSTIQQSLFDTAALKNLHKSFGNTKISSLIDNSLLSLAQEKSEYHKEDPQRSTIPLKTL